MSAVVQFPRPVANGKTRGVRRDGALSSDPLGGAVSGIIHDFNNLITGILLYAELLSNELPSDARSHYHVEQIQKAAENSAGLIRQLLAIARPEAESLLEASWNQSIAESLDLLRRMAGEHIEIATDLAANLSTVHLGSAQMQQILLNLVLNARDAMPDGGRILIRTNSCSEIRGQATDFVELSVCDSGKGMDPAHRAHLFEPFHTTKAKGSGLGLYAIHRLVEQRCGRVQVESAPRKGTRITIQLPRAVQVSKKSSSEAKR